MKDPLKEKVRPRRRPSSSGRLGKSTDRNPPAHEAQERKLSQRMPRGWQAGFRKAFDQAAIGMALVGLDEIGRASCRERVTIMVLFVALRIGPEMRRSE